MRLRRQKMKQRASKGSKKRATSQSQSKSATPALDAALRVSDSTEHENDALATPAVPLHHHQEQQHESREPATLEVSPARSDAASSALTSLASDAERTEDANLVVPTKPLELQQLQPQGSQNESTEWAASRALSTGVSSAATPASPATPHASALPSNIHGQSLPRIEKAICALAANKRLTVRRAAELHHVSRTALSRRLRTHRVPGVESPKQRDDECKQRQDMGRKREDKGKRREDHDKQSEFHDEERGIVAASGLTATEERQVICYIGLLMEMGVNLHHNMVDKIAAKVISRRGDPLLDNKEATERLPAGFLRSWGLGDKFGFKDSQEVDDCEDDDIGAELRAASTRDDVVAIISRLIESETDPANFKRLAMSVAMFTAEAIEYQSMLEHMVQRYNVSLVQLKVLHHNGARGNGDEADDEHDEMDIDEEEDEEEDMGQEEAENLNVNGEDEVHPGVVAAARPGSKNVTFNVATQSVQAGPGQAVGPRDIRQRVVRGPNKQDRMASSPSL